MNSTKYVIAVYYLFSGDQSKWGLSDQSYIEITTGHFCRQDAPRDTEFEITRSIKAGIVGIHLRDTRVFTHEQLGYLPCEANRTTRKTKASDMVKADSARSFE